MGWPLHFFLISCCLTVNFVVGYKYNICAQSKDNAACQQLERDENFKCINVDNEASCLTKIEAGEIDFGSVDSETAVLASRLTNKLIAVAEIIPEDVDTEMSRFNYELVIVSKKSITKFDELKGKSYFHPGFDRMDDVLPFLLKEFEMEIFRLTKDSLQACDKNFETVSETLVYALNEFFGPSCRPGKWVADEELDKKLKEKYPNLTKLCTTEPSSGFSASLNYMLNNPNGISLTTLGTIQNEISEDATINYLCKNGSTSNKVCVWSKQPYRLIVKNNNPNNNRLEDELNQNFLKYRDPVNKVGDGISEFTDTERRYLPEILGFSNIYKLWLEVNHNKSLGDYLKGLRDIPTQDDSKICKKSMRWCTVSAEEQEKCKWLSQASLNYGIHPVVECVQKSHEFECLEAINKDKEEADLITLPADYGYASKRNNLTAIMFPETSTAQEIHTLLLVKGENITRLEDLKHKKGCFPLYTGIAWLSFVNTTRSVILPTDSCDYGKLVSDALGDSCMPGASSSVRSRAIQNNVDEAKMCKLCIDTGRTCDANEATNWYYGNSGAIKCLEQSGDFAVIEKTPSLVLPNNVRVMCRNGTISTLDGVDVDEHCYLSILTTSEVVTRRDDPKNMDIKLALQEYDSWFTRPYSPFRLFDSFNGTKDLLFKDSTPGLDLPTSHKQAIKNYVDTFKHIDNCAVPMVDPGGSNNSTTSKASFVYVTTFLLTLPLLIIQAL